LAGRGPAKLPPVRARAEVFQLAAESTRSRSEILTVACQRLKVSRQGLEEALFSDLPDERIVRAPAEPVAASELALRANLALAQSILHRAASVENTVVENVRAVVRLARLRGLICTVRAGERSEFRLSISGPFALFRHTLVYGRHSAIWCRSSRGALAFPLPPIALSRDRS
jgi:predicted nuclease of restriction endonuclease-like RecB superfamily